MPFEGHLSNGRYCAILGLCDTRPLARAEVIGVSRGNLRDPRSIVRSELSCAVEVTGAIRSHCHFGGLVSSIAIRRFQCGRGNFEEILMITYAPLER